MQPICQKETWPADCWVLIHTVPEAETGTFLSIDLCTLIFSNYHFVQVNERWVFHLLQPRIPPIQETVTWWLRHKSNITAWWAVESGFKARSAVLKALALSSLSCHEMVIQTLGKLRRPSLGLKCNSDEIISISLKRLDFKQQRKYLNV